MCYAYKAEIWCDSCGQDIRKRLELKGKEDTGDTDDFPQWGDDDEYTDSPQHCAAGEKCLERLDLSEYGEIRSLYGAETNYIGALIGTNLTGDGESYLNEMLSETPRTDYQAALQAFWREAFSDYITSEADHDDES